jgi:hypothetical protein
VPYSPNERAPGSLNLALLSERLALHLNKFRSSVADLRRVRPHVLDGKKTALFLLPVQFTLDVPEPGAAMGSRFTIGRSFLVGGIRGQGVLQMFERGRNVRKQRRQRSKRRSATHWRFTKAPSAKAMSLRQTGSYATRTSDLQNGPGFLRRGIAD